MTRVNGSEEMPIRASNKEKVDDGIQANSTSNNHMVIKKAGDEHNSRSSPASSKFKE